MALVKLAKLNFYLALFVDQISYYISLQGLLLRILSQLFTHYLNYYQTNPNFYLNILIDSYPLSLWQIVAERQKSIAAQVTYS